MGGRAAAGAGAAGEGAFAFFSSLASFSAAGDAQPHGIQSSGHGFPSSSSPSQRTSISHALLLATGRTSSTQSMTYSPSLGPPLAAGGGVAGAGAFAFGGGGSSFSLPPLASPPSPPLPTPLLPAPDEMGSSDATNLDAKARL